MACVLGCIADDFTGATDLAALLSRSGAPVSLRIGVPSDPPSEASSIEVIALKIRTEPRDEAVRQALAAQQWLEAAGAQRYFWKYCSTFDSTAEGNIGPVSEALMAATNASQTVYCPAFPENGRSIFMGHLFVGDQLLSESPMRHHPLTPMRDSLLTRVLEPQVERGVGLVKHATVAQGPASVRAALDALAEEGKAHVVVDAVADADLGTIAAACRNDVLMTGGSAVAMPLPNVYADDGLLSWDSGADATGDLPEKTVVLSGSCSSMTQAQVAHYRAGGAPSYRLDPLALSKEGVAPVLAWLSEQDFSAAPLVYATAEPESVLAVQEALGVAAAGEMVEQALAACAAHARDCGARRFIVAGGETSGAVTQSLGAVTLRIGSEIAPGVPWTYCVSGGHEIALTLKSGNFGNTDFFRHAQAVLGSA